MEFEYNYSCFFKEVFLAETETTLYKKLTEEEKFSLILSELAKQCMLRGMKDE